MDPNLLRYYKRELQYMREMGQEFATEYEKIAGRLGIEGEKVADPYVERLMEGFAFLAARVHLKIDAEFPAFTQNLLDIVYPHYLSPLPSMAVAQFQPVLEEGALVEGFVLNKGTSLQGKRSRGQKTACEFRSGHDVTLWPLEVTEAKYFGSAGSLATANVETLAGTRSGMRLSLRATGGAAFNDLAIDNLRLFINGKDGLSSRIYEQLLGHTLSVVVRAKGGKGQWQTTLPGESLRPVGFRRDESLLPNPNRSFDGYRILQEYFGFPERFQFVDITGLSGELSHCNATEIEVIILSERRDPDLEGLIDAQNFLLNCAPVVNLFPKRSDRIHLTDRDHEYHLIADRTRPLDFEIWSITDLQGFGSNAAPEQAFEPLYAHHNRSRSFGGAFYTSRRMPRELSTKQKERGSRSSYVGSEVYLSLVDAEEAPYASSLRQVEAQILCTNRDLALHLPVGQGQTDFTLETGAPVEAVRCVAGPTRPRPSKAHGQTAWQLVSHLSLNYLSLVNEPSNEQTEQGAAAMRTILRLYSDEEDLALQHQIDGVKSIESKSINGRIPTDGPITFGRGVEVTLTCDESAFEGVGVFLFGQVMAEFLAKYVSTNSFTETVLRSGERGEIMRWRPRLGQRRLM